MKEHVCVCVCVCVFVRARVCVKAVAGDKNDEVFTMEIL
jgi:hypothetical protein